MIDFHFNRQSGVPTYLQLVQQVEHALRLGYLKPGDQLPTVRSVVAELTINPNTVLKAYKDLEQKGLVGGRPGQGTFVLNSLGAPSAQHARLRRDLEAWLRDARQAGMDRASITALFATVLNTAEADDAAGGVA